MLGATPEIIDMLIRRDSRTVTAMDWREYSVAGMALLAKEDWLNVEVIVSDWREPVPELEGRVENVLADGSFATLDFPDGWKRTADNIHRYLVPGGRIITRSYYVQSEPVSYTVVLDQALERYKSASRGLAPAERTGPYMEMVSEVLLAVILGAIDGDGQLDEDQRARDRADALKTLSTAVQESFVAEIIESFLATAPGTPRSGYTATHGMPRWEPAMQMFAEAGFEVEVVDSTCDGWLKEIARMTTLRAVS